MPRLKDQEGVWLQRFRDDFSGNREKEEMTDVTLVCKDGSLPAHSLILASVSQQLHKTLANLVEREEDGMICVILPDVTVCEVKPFLDCLYGEKLPGKRPKDIKAVKDVFSLLSGLKMSQDFTETEKETGLHKTASENKDRDARPNMVEDPRSEGKEIQDESDTGEDSKEKSPTKVNIEEPSCKLANKSSKKADKAVEERGNVEEEKKSDGGDVVASREGDVVAPREGDVVASRYLGRQERAERLTAKLESLCEFCRNPVSSHRVTIMVKEKVYIFFFISLRILIFIIISIINILMLILIILKVTSKLVCCMCGSILSNPSSFVKHHKAEVKQRTGIPLPELWSFFCPICRLPLSDHRMQCCHCQENFPTHGALTLHLKTLQVAAFYFYINTEK